MEAREASSRIPEMKSAGAARVVVLVKEDIGTEVEDFRAAAWSDEVLLDEEKQFFLALGGGKENKSFSLAGFLAHVLNPFSKSRTKAALALADSNKVQGNLTGEGFINGGVYVIRTDGKAAYAFPEEQLGDRASVDDVIEGIKAAVRGEEYSMAPEGIAGAAEDKTRRTWKEWAGRPYGPDCYIAGDITRGIAASWTRRKSRNSRNSNA